MLQMAALEPCRDGRVAQGGQQAPHREECVGGAYAGWERADSAAAATMVHRARLEGAPCSFPGHRWSSWPVALWGPALGRNAIDHNRTPQRSGALGDPRL